jgi:hypothetical protein
MKLVYTNENLCLVSNAKNIIESHGIDTILKNEFARGAIGEISPFDAWPEVWVNNDSDYEQAVKIIDTSFNNTNGAAWVCKECNEENDASFESCWNCQNENS